MNKEYWQTKKQMQQLQCGNTTTARVKAYIQMWESRCYSSGLPDGEEVPPGLMKGYRVPSYKKIALAVLRNDHKMKSLGFSAEDSELSRQLSRIKTESESEQGSLF